MPLSRIQVDILRLLGGKNVESGQLPLHTLRGTIKDVYMGSMADWPEFKMLSDTCEESSWTRLLQSAELDRFYRVGARIDIDYVWQQSRAKSFDHGSRREHVIEVRIDPKIAENAFPGG